MIEHCRIQVEMLSLLDRAQILKAAEVLKIDLAIIQARPSSPLLALAGIEEAQVGIATQLGDQVQMASHHAVDVFLFGIEAIGSQIVDAFG